MGWGGLLSVVSVLLTVHPEHESDPFWHFNLGRAVLRHHARVVPEPSAFASYGRDAVVPEWLWGVGTYLLHEAGSFTALVGLLVVLAVGMTAMVVTLARLHTEEEAPEVVILVSSLIVALAAARLRLRPQAAFVALAPCFLYLCYRFREARGRGRVALAAGLCALEVLWAQLHGSFVLAPAIFAIWTPAWRSQ